MRIAKQSKTLLVQTRHRDLKIYGPEKTSTIRAGSNPTTGELFKRKTVTDAEVAAVDAYMADPTTTPLLLEGGGASISPRSP
ncbi:hypothetical protein [Methylobacterium durans]|uniref:Uncharacterized protein n=1 Tax=Methylobacterium durans TaxID=2202825 RepID=A0A2U8WBM5_9HYPH|nr:hypothetical protein [Methylobacterium durans]AWN43564.1 hypothetical protein DK389_27490 [Methylobacterium durans]